MTGADVMREKGYGVISTDDMPYACFRTLCVNCGHTLLVELPCDWQHRESGCLRCAARFTVAGRVWRKGKR